MAARIPHGLRPTSAVVVLLASLLCLRMAPATVARSTLVVAQSTATEEAVASGAAFIGWAQPAPWLLALLLAAILTVLWLFAVGRFLRADAGAT